MDEGPKPNQPSRTVVARRRARTAQLALGLAGAAVFAGSMVLVRAHAAGHAKHGVRPLEAPRSFLDTVRRDALQGGVIAPAQAPPQATTSQS